MTCQSNSAYLELADYAKSRFLGSNILKANAVPAVTIMVSAEHLGSRCSQDILMHLQAAKSRS